MQILSKWFVGILPSYYRCRIGYNTERLVIGKCSGIPLERVPTYIPTYLPMLKQNEFTSSRKF